jgi:hypothetical protein
MAMISNMIDSYGENDSLRKIDQNVPVRARLRARRSVVRERAMDAAYGRAPSGGFPPLKTAWLEKTLAD